MRLSQPQRSRWDSAKEYWGKHFLGLEGVCVLLATLALIIWTDSDRHSTDLNEFLLGSRASLYGVLATLWGALLGFVITSVSIVLTTSQDERLKIVRESTQYPTLWRVFMSTIRSLAAATIAAVLCLLIDRDPPNGHPVHWAFYLAFGTSLLATARLARSIWVLQRVVTLVSGESKERSG